LKVILESKVSKIKIEVFFNDTRKATKTESVKDLLSVVGVNFQFPLPLSKEAKLLH
jgi:hypothetical protein